MKGFYYALGVSILIGAIFWALEKNKLLNAQQKAFVQAEEAISYYKDKYAANVDEIASQETRIQKLQAEKNALKIHNSELLNQQNAFIQTINQLKSTIQSKDLEREKLTNEIYILKKELLKDF